MVRSWVTSAMILQSFYKLRDALEMPWIKVDFCFLRVRPELETGWVLSIFLH